MNPRIAFVLARSELARWPQLAGWRVVISSRMSRTLGLCRYRSKTIQLSLAHVQLNDVAKVRDTVLHEIAHALVGPGHGHDRVWRAMAVQIGAEPVRCDSNAVMPSGKWIAVCPSCGRCFHRYRKPRLNRRRYCRACGPNYGPLTFTTNVEPPE